MNNRRNTNLATRRNNYNNYKELKNLQRTLDNFFYDFWWPNTSALSEAWEEFQPQSKLTEEKDKYLLEVNLPGVKKENVKIEVEENIVKISGERKEEKKQDEAKQHYSEIFYGKFYREFALPTQVKKEKVKAHYENGVLTTTVTKDSQSHAHQVNIE